MEAYAVHNKHTPESVKALLEGDLDTRMHFYRHIDEVQARLAACRRGREPVWRAVRAGRAACYKRWGTNPGSIRIRSQRVPVRVPRVRDTEAGEERPLETYRALHRPTEEDQDRIAESIFLGLSQRDYPRVARTYADCFGLSASSISRTFQERSAKALEDLEQRSLASDPYVALLIDGKSLQDRQIVLCLGLTADGTKKVLGFVETSTEHAEAVAAGPVGPRPAL